MWLAPEPGLVWGVLLVAEKKLQELLWPGEGGLADSRIQMVTLDLKKFNQYSLWIYQLFSRFALTDKQFKLTHINLNFLYYYDGFEEAD